MKKENLPQNKLHVRETLHLNFNIIKSLIVNFKLATVTILVLQVLTAVLNVFLSISIILFIQKAVNFNEASSSSVVPKLLGNKFQSLVDHITIIHIVIAILALSIGLALMSLGYKFLIFSTTRALEARLYKNAILAISKLTLKDYRKLDPQFYSANQLSITLRQDLRMYILSARLLVNSLSAYFFILIVVIAAALISKTILLFSFVYLIVTLPLILPFIRQALEHSQKYNFLVSQMNAAKNSILKASLSSFPPDDFEQSVEEEIHHTGRIGRFLKSFEFRFQILNLMDFFMKLLIGVYIGSVLMMTIIFKENFKLNYLVFFTILPFALSAWSRIIMSLVSVGRLTDSAKNFHQLKTLLEQDIAFEEPAITNYVNLNSGIKKLASGQRPDSMIFGMISNTELQKPNIYTIIDIVLSLFKDDQSANHSYQVIDVHNTNLENSSNSTIPLTIEALISNSSARFIFVSAKLVSTVASEDLLNIAKEKILIIYDTNTRPHILKYESILKCLFVVNNLTVSVPSSYVKKVPKDLFGLEIEHMAPDVTKAFGISDGFQE